MGILLYRHRYSAKYLSLLLKAVQQGLKGNTVANLDKEHLKEAKRLGPDSCRQ